MTVPAEPADRPRSPWRGRVAATLLLVLAGVALSVLLLSCGQEETASHQVLPSASVSPSTAAETVVYVSGRVKRPGVYRLRPGARIGDAIDRAGGLEADADAESVNLARRAVDGEQIHLPARGEAAAGGAGITEGTEGAADSGTGPINLNRATEAQLQLLPRIGEATARKIIDDRERNGPFSSVDDLARVPGIGEKTIEGLRDQATM